MQVKQHLERTVQGIKVVGTTYPVPLARDLAARAVGAAQMAALVRCLVCCWCAACVCVVFCCWSHLCVSQTQHATHTTHTQALLFFGDRIFAGLGYAQPPRWYTDNLPANKGTAALGLWIVGNMLTGSLSQTGAFEIYFDGGLAFSKLATGRLPNAAEFDALVARIYSAHAAAAAAAGGAAAA
jgi:selT/selW/selH-like putative selenoprotein